jgi:hypothetical protein
MKRRQKLLLLLLVVVLLSQIPFAYRRYRLGRLNAAIQSVNSQLIAAQDNTGFIEYKGVVHVHSFLGGHSRGNFEEIIAAAKSNQLNFVVMTEHTSENFDTAAMTLNGDHGGVLFINGNETTLANGDRYLLVPGVQTTHRDSNFISVEDIARSGRGREGLTFVAYPQEYRGWASSFYDGVEVYNVYTNAQQINPLVMFFDALWSYRSYPDLLFANFYSRPGENLRKWDEAITATGRRLTAIAGNDSHANVGISLNDASGRPLLGFKLDPYERSFRLVRVHAFISRDKPLSSESLLEALSKGHCFIGFDLFGDTSGFSFTASNGTENKIQGDEITFQNEARLTVNAPVTSRVVLLKDGKTIQDDAGIKRKDYVVTERGSYRVEVYLPQLPKPAAEQPWIISNPIYVK